MVERPREDSGLGDSVELTRNGTPRPTTTQAATSVLSHVFVAIVAESDAWTLLYAGLYIAAGTLTLAKLLLLVTGACGVVFQNLWLMASTMMTFVAIFGGVWWVRCTSAISIDHCINLIGRLQGSVWIQLLLTLRAGLRLLSAWARISATVSLLVNAAKANDTVMMFVALALHAGITLKWLPTLPKNLVKGLQVLLLIRAGRVDDASPLMLFLLANLARSQALGLTQNKLQIVITAFFTCLTDNHGRQAISCFAADGASFAKLCLTTSTGTVLHAVPKLRDAAGRLLQQWRNGSTANLPSLADIISTVEMLTPTGCATHVFGVFLCCPETFVTIAACVLVSRASAWSCVFLALCSFPRIVTELLNLCLVESSIVRGVSNFCYQWQYLLACDGSRCASAMLLALKAFTLAHVTVTQPGSADVYRCVSKFGWIALMICFSVDLVGMMSLIFPPLEALDLAYAPVAFMIIKSVIGGWFLPGATALKELLPFTDVIPVSLVAWCYKYPEHVFAIACSLRLAPQRVL